MKITIVALRVLDQDSALKFYTETLGFTQTEDMDLGGMRWLTVAPPDQPELNILLERVGPPFVDGETAAQLDAIVAKGAGGTLFFQVEDVRGVFDRSSTRASRSSRSRSSASTGPTSRSATTPATSSASTSRPRRTSRGPRTR